MPSTSSSLFSVVLLIVLMLSVSVNANGTPSNGKKTLPIPNTIILNAPYTSFNNDATRSINLTPIASLAQYAASVGVNTIWVNGGLGQFETLTVDERKQIAVEWITQAHKHNLFVIVHVGTNSVPDAVELASHAAQVGADAIASVPTFYESPSSLQGLVDFLKPITAAAPNLPFFYYHIPGSTHVNIRMSDFFAIAPQQLPTLAGVKFVSTDLGDYLNCTQTYPSFQWMFAPEPKLAGIPLGARSVILAEDFFAPTWLRMWSHYQQGDIAAAQTEQMWKLSVSNVFNNFGGEVAGRYLYRKLIGVDLGPARWPVTPLSDNEVALFINQLTPFNFFNQSIPQTQFL